MNIKKSAYEAITKKLEDELSGIQSKISRNKWNFKCLAEEQSKLKWERGIITSLIREVKGQEKVNVKEQTNG